MLEYFENTWALTEQPFSSLASDEAYYVRHHKTRHPLVFYYAHPVCFYVNKMLVSGLIDKPVNQEFEPLFETGVDEMNWDDLHEGEQDVWPALDQVRQYRDAVYELVRQVIRTHPSLDKPITIASPAWSLAMGFEHERDHLETSSVLIRELPLEYVKEPDVWPDWLTAPAAQNYEPVGGADYPTNELPEVAPTASVSASRMAGRLLAGTTSTGRISVKSILSGPASSLSATGNTSGSSRPGVMSSAGTGLNPAGVASVQKREVADFLVQDGPAGSHRFKLRTTSEIPMQWSWPAWSTQAAFARLAHRAGRGEDAVSSAAGE